MKALRITIGMNEAYEWTAELKGPRAPANRAVIRQDPDGSRWVEDLECANIGLGDLKALVDEANRVLDDA